MKKIPITSKNRVIFVRLADRPRTGLRVLTSPVGAFLQRVGGLPARFVGVRWHAAKNVPILVGAVLRPGSRRNFQISGNGGNLSML